MDLQKLRAFWAHRQGLLALDEHLSFAEVLSRYGWARSVAGCNPYFTGFTRAGISREVIDVAVANLEVSELPAARGCTYVVPKVDFSVALKVGESGGESKLAISLGASEEELIKLQDAVHEVILVEALEPNAIRLKLGPMVRNFGEEGKKKGLTTSLPVALGKLQSEGRIIRRPISGRLDEQRYAYIAWPNPGSNPKTLGRDEALQRLATLFFQWSGIASLSEFAIFSGLSLKLARSASQHLNLAPLVPDSGLLATKETLEEFEMFQAPDRPIYRLLNCLDSLFLLRENLSWLIPEAFEQRMELLNGPAKRGVRKEIGFNAIVDRGAIVGVWEFDPDGSEIVFQSFAPASAELKSEMDRTQGYIVDQLGDARTFSLDSPKSRKPKIERLREAE